MSFSLKNFKLKNIFDPSGYILGGGWSGSKGIINPDEKSDQEKYVEELMRQLAELQSQMPNLFNTYNTESQKVLDSWKSPEKYSFISLNPSDFESGINKQYDIATKNLNRSVGANVMNAQSSAGAQAAAYGLANPASFVSNKAQAVRDSFVPAYGQLEAGRASALADIMQKIGMYNNQGLNNVNQMNTSATNTANMNYTQLLQQLMSGRMNAMQGDWANKMGIFNAKAGMANFKDPYTGFDKFMNFAGQTLPAVAKFF